MNEQKKWHFLLMLRASAFADGALNACHNSHYDEDARNNGDSFGFCTALEMNDLG